MTRAEKPSTLGNIIIRQETAADFALVRETVRQAFGAMDDSDHTEHLLVERLRRSGAYVPGLALVADAGGRRAVGYIMLTEVRVEDGGKAATALALAPLAVTPGLQGRGIGSMLVCEAHRRAAAMGYRAAVVLGHKDYYPEFGYRRASHCGISFPFDAPDECCMVAELVPGGLLGMYGAVRYPEAFFT